MKNRLMKDLKEAMKSTDENKAIRLASVKAVRQAVAGYEKDNPGYDITEEAIAPLIDGLIKTRQKSVDIFTKENRLDLADVEQTEINFIKVYLPKRVDTDEIKTAALIIKDEIGATGMRDMGKMMGLLKSKFGASAKPADISTVVKEILS